jgi:hypothetical protein
MIAALREPVCQLAHKWMGFTPFNRQGGEIKA